MSSDSRLRTRVLKRLALTPSVLVPAFLGAGALAAGLGAGLDPWASGFVALCGLAASIGALATRWLWRLEAITRDAAHDLAREDMLAAERRLDALDRRLQGDRDPRDNDLLSLLRALRGLLHQEVGRAGSASRSQLAEVSRKAEDLFQSCVATLERSRDLWDAAQAMSTREGKERVMASRERLLGEVKASVEHLARIHDDVKSLGVEGGDEHRLASLRQELHESLGVARRVEERMAGLRRELESGDQESTRSGPNADGRVSE